MSGRASLNDSLTSEVEVPSRQPVSLRKYKIGLYVCGICTLIFIVLSSISAVVLGALINGQAKDGVVLTSGTENLWAHIPGDTDTLVLRNYTFFDLENPKEVLYRNAKPSFREVSGYVIQEFNDMENIKYVEDGNVAEFDFWLHFEERDSRSLDEKVSTLNLGPLGFWAGVQIAPDENFTLNGFGPLYVELRDTLKNTVLGQGVSEQYLPDYKTFESIAAIAELDEKTTKFLWQDSLYGLSDPDHFLIWVEASEAGLGSPQSNHLQNYFYITSIQMQTLLYQIRDWSESLNVLIGNWYCGSSECSSQQMVFKQLSGSLITKNPPPGSDPIESICSTNITCIGYPEINNYLEHIFKAQYPDRTDCFDVIYTQDEFRKFFTPSSNSTCLLHAGNLNKLFYYGKFYDQYHDIESLTAIKAMFELDSDEKTFVFWNWVKYFTYEFVLKQSKSGTKGIAGIGGVASQALYESFSASAGWLSDTMMSTKVAVEIKSEFVTCQGFFALVLDDISQDQVNNICDGVNLDQPETLLPIINSCKYLYSEAWDKLKTKGQLSYIQMNQICDPEELSVQFIIDNSEIDLENFYNCTFTPEIGCSDFEIGYKQWNESLITRNPIPQLTLTPSWTVNDWNSDLPTFQYSYYLYYMESTCKFRPNLTQIVDLLSFDKLFNGQMIQELWTMNETSFKEWFYWDNQDVLKEYLRYIVIEVGFGGFTQQRKARELIFGYDDPFLVNLRDMDPILGGDPSTASYIAFNEPNSTKEEAVMFPQAMFTGKNDSSVTRFYAKLNGKNTITMNYSYWNGDDVVSSIKSPWAIDDHFIGTDAFQVSPGIDVNDPNTNMSIFINTLYRYGNAVYNDSINRFDFDIVRAKIPPSIFESKYERPYNEIYYQQYHGFINATSTTGVPMFISKNHFLDAPSNWSELIDIYDENRTFVQNASVYDDTYILLEPTTGTSFTATIYLQSNYELKQDELFSRSGLMMLPIFTVWRSGNMSEHAIDQYFGDLRTGLKIKSKITFFMIAIAGLCLVFTLIIFVKFRREKTNQLQKPSSLITNVDE